MEDNFKVLVNSEISEEKWNNLLSGSSYTSAFQTPAFYQLVNSVNKLTAKVFAIEDELGLKILCVVTLQKELGFKSYFSRRAIIYGGPVLRNQEKNSFEYLIKYVFNEFKKNSIYIEIRSLNDYSQLDEVFKRNNWKYLNYVNYQINCQNKESIFKNLGNNRKRQIKKATEYGVEVNEVKSQVDIQEFYSILEMTYKKTIKKPLLPLEFFIEFIKQDFGKILVVKYLGKIIGGIACPILDNTRIYEFYICGMDKEYKDQHPSVMATWSAISYANNNNIPVFDFMGAGRKDSVYGVRDFKARFGGDLVEHGRYIRINNMLLYKIGEIALKLIKAVVR